jgi:hypothetical protein
LDPIDERAELQRRLEQSRRLGSGAVDPTTTERLKLLALELELKIRKAN